MSMGTMLISRLKQIRLIDNVFIQGKICYSSKARQWWKMALWILKKKRGRSVFLWITFLLFDIFKFVGQYVISTMKIFDMSLGTTDKDEP